METQYKHVVREAKEMHTCWMYDFIEDYALFCENIIKNSPSIVSPWRESLLQRGEEAKQIIKTIQNDANHKFDKEMRKMEMMRMEQRSPIVDIKKV